VVEKSLTRSRGELSDFLVQHRHQLTPADVGLPSTTRRRTPGLRREEVATLAGVGLTWYTWFEQGREINVSEAFLLNVARALKLDDADCCHLFLLAHRRPPPVDVYRWQSIPPRVQELMDDMTRPAYVINLRWDLIAWNAAADALFDVSAQAAQDRNLMRMVFSSPSLRRRLPEWRDDAFRLLAQFRCTMAATPDDPEIRRLIDDLSRLSPDWRRWWDMPGLGKDCFGLGTLLDENGKRREFDHETLIVDEHRHLRMVIYFDTTADASQ